ncbi:hypothetical protein HD841_000212 [Sphingomonas melonis]|uniref:Uncharacterized protein n=1 Tax=Sphingomonas melonis TaxID=152682 RepID=A0A7Y9JZ40_9SPHN|nr:hypothetical protein [Sphingomonas melonis]
MAQIGEGLAATIAREERGTTGRQLYACSGGKSVEGVRQADLEQPAIITRAVNDVENNDCGVIDTIEDHVIAMDATADAFRFLAGDQRKPTRKIGQVHALRSQHTDMFNRRPGVFARDIVADILQVVLG